MIPAHAVPCPHRSPASSSAIAISSPSRVTATDRCTVPTSGWSSSTPLSSTHTRTPSPRAPSQAQSRVTRSGHAVGSAIRSTAPAGRLQAGRSSSRGLATERS